MIPVLTFRPAVMSHSLKYFARLWSSLRSYVYKRGLQNHQYSFATAVGMFESVVNLVLLCTVNFVSKRMTESSLF